MVQFELFLIAFICALGSVSPQPEDRIVGGREVDIKNFPWQISLQRGGKHTCGGSIISKEWVVTAAHCVKGHSPSAIKIRSGSSLHASGGTLHTVSEIQIHPQHQYIIPYDNDVALLKVANFFVPNGNTVKFVPLAAEGKPTAVGANVTVSGWGATKEGGSAPAKLQAVSLAVVDPKICDKNYGGGRVTTNMMCSGFEKGGSSACQGDSGGPLVDQNNVLIGVVSWGSGCGRPNKPGVQTRISAPSIRQFIKLHTGI